MSEIKCPHCGQVFTVDETEYEAIVYQVRNKEFEKEVSNRLHDLQKTMESDTKIKVLSAEKKATESVEKKLKEKEDALSKALLEIATLKGELNTASVSFETDLKLQKAELESKTREEIETLKAKLKEAEASKDSEIKLLKLELESKAKEELDIVKSTYDKEKKMLQEEVEHYKEFKARSSTKMVGESLEQHCMDEFDKLRATAFRSDYFEKDNEISETGSKGDFIYRAYDDEGNELVSIMFEMKNEMESTEKSQKHKNADFFKELDKDRKEKDCEYAVLCSLLEADSELYNQGIVDVSHRYEKMYVIRPQFFIPIITLLRNAALSQVTLKKELVAAKQTNIDIIAFETELNAFKTAFGKNCELASRKFSETIDELDKAIDHLQKTKNALLSCDRNLQLADKKADELKVKKLLKNSPSLEDEYERKTNQE